MRLRLAAIFCSALLSDLLNMKRFALQGDTGRGSLPGAHQPPCPSSLCVTQVSWRALFHSSTPRPQPCAHVSDTVTGITAVS